MMDRRSFVSLTALGGVALVLPGALVGCGGAAGGPDVAAAGGGQASGEQGAPGGQGVAPTAANTGFTVAGKGWQSRRFGDASGNLFDVYGLQNRVDFLTPAITVTSGLNLPIALAVDARERVLVLELGGERVSAFDLAGRALGRFASGVQLRYPLDLATSAAGAGSVAIADTLNHRIVLLDGNGNPTSSLGSQGTGSANLNGPASVAFGPDGSTLYVADQGNGRVQIYSVTGGSSGRVVASLGSRGTAAGELLQPCCLRLDGGGTLYVADAVGGYVSVFDPSGRFVRRFRPTLPDGTAGVPVWISNQPGGSLLVGAVVGAPA